MSFIIKSRVRESTTTTGTTDFALGGAISGYRAFSSVMVNSDTTWYACVLPGGAWEEGIGTWVTGNTLQRTTVLDSSNGGSKVVFGAGTKDVFIALPASKGNIQNNTFLSGTLMLFQQTNAPLYWTKQVTHNDKSLRVVSGTASSGGSNAFSTIFNGTIATNSTTITQSTMASHAHSYNIRTGATVGGGGAFGPVDTLSSATTGSAGGDGSHQHTINLNLQFVDLILCSKD